MRRLTSNPWIVCLSAASFFFFQYIQITSFNVIKPDLMIAFNTSSSDLSLLASVYFYGTIFFLIPAGILLDYISTRIIILSAMLTSLLGLLIFSTADSIYVAGIGRFLIGISGGPFCFLGTMRVAARWFPADRFAFVTGVIVSVAMLGGIVAQTPFVYLLEAVGWRQAMYIDLLLGAFITLIIYLFVQDYPEGKKQEYLQQLNYYREIGFVRGLKTVMLSAQNWYNGIFASLLNLPIFVFGALFGILYLTQSFNMTRIEGSMICSGLFFGMLTGAPAFGYISDKLHLRKVPMLFGLIVCFIALMIVLQSNSLSFISLMILFYLIGFGASAHILVYPTVTESNPVALAGSALSLCSTCIMAGGAIFQPVIGRLLEMNWNNFSDSNGVAIYSTSDFRFALTLVPICIVLCLIFISRINETYCKRLAQ